ncbi:MAG: dihydrofolate reductase family protein [Candidatus Nanopelagicales bacterium]
MDDEQLWRSYAWPQQSLRVNFVTSIDGHIQGPDGLSGTLSNPHDRRLFHMLRAGCDAVLVGAGTARREKYRPIQVKAEWSGLRSQTQPPVLIMVSASGNVPDIEGAVISDGTDLREIKDRYPRILCEGGPHLFTALLEQGFVDELALSVSAMLGGAGHLLTGTVTAGAIPKHAHTAPEGIFTLWDIT